jgi:single-strand DNA-binding protein
MAQSYEMEGTVKVIDDIQTFASGFTKREFVVEVEDGKFPQSIKFECVKEKTALIDGFGIGDPVKVFFDIRGNEYKGKYYVNLNAWKLERPGAGGGGSRKAPPAAEWDDAPPLSEPPGGYGQESDDDIPF